jgi:hypothetical protein
LVLRKQGRVEEAELFEKHAQASLPAEYQKSEVASLEEPIEMYDRMVSVFSGRSTGYFYIRPPSTALDCGG